MRHELKCWPPQYEAMRRGDKTFDIRRNDRGFQTGDMVVQKAYDPRARQYLDEEACPPLFFEITYVLSGPMYGLREDYVCMALEPLDEDGAEREAP